MGFFNKFTKPKAEIELKIANVDLNERKIKGTVCINCMETTQINEVRLEAQASEAHRETKVTLTGVQVKQHTDVYFDQKIPVYGGFEGAPGFKGEYPFEIAFPGFASRHGSQVNYKLKAVAGIQGRPDLTTKEIDPYKDATIIDSKEKREKMENYFKNVKPIS
jgi:hypothetical protein